jgi:hypothetical protein
MSYGYQTIIREGEARLRLEFFFTHRGATRI